MYGLTSAQIANGPVNVSGTTYLTAEPAISTAPPYVTLIPAPVTNTLVISGGGTVTMAASLPGITRVELMKPTNLTLNSTPNLVVFGTAAEIGGSTIGKLVAGDTVDVTNLVLRKGHPHRDRGRCGLDDADGTDGGNTAKVTLNGAFSAGSFQLRSDGNGGTDISFQPGPAMPTRCRRRR